MSAEQEQPRNVSDLEVQLIKATFTEELLKTIRALFLGLGVSDVEKATIKDTFKSDELMALMTKRLYPTLAKDTPIGQVQDIWLGAESMVFGQSTDAIYQAIHYKQQALDMTKMALALLADPSGPTPKLDYSPFLYVNDPTAVNLLARNQFIRHVEQQLLFLWLIAQQKVETPATMEKKRATNSTK